MYTRISTYCRIFNFKSNLEGFDLHRNFCHTTTKSILREHKSLGKKINWVIIITYAYCHMSLKRILCVI